MLGPCLALTNGYYASSSHQEKKATKYLRISRKFSQETARGTAFKFALTLTMDNNLGLFSYRICTVVLTKIASWGVAQRLERAPAMREGPGSMPGFFAVFFSFKKQLRNSLLRLYKYIIIYLIYCLANVYQCCMIFKEICFKINNLGKTRLLFLN